MRLTTPVMRIDALRMLALMIAFWAGTGCGQAETKGILNGQSCSLDGSCLSGFCDAGQCAEPSGPFGAVCTPAPRTSDGLRDGKLNVCGAYLCLNGRCRSCVSDTQCKEEYGAPRCRSLAPYPGRRCGA